MKLPSTKSAKEARETIIGLQRWLSQYSREDATVDALVIHLYRARSSLEKLWVRNDK